MITLSDVYSALVTAEDTIRLLEERNHEMEIAVAQAVEFAEYVEGAAKGKMVERAKHFLSTPYAKELAERLRKTRE
jgi:predicted ribosome-associated RNA-binding protein Tma20